MPETALPLNLFFRRAGLALPQRLPSYSHVLPTVFSLYPQTGTPAREVISTILTGRNFRLEHILSYAEASPDGFWYDQSGSEWVALIQGAAGLEFPDGSLNLQAGDCLLIEARLQHRVSFTSPDAVWIALHFDADSSAEPAVPATTAFKP